MGHPLSRGQDGCSFHRVALSLPCFKPRASQWSLGKLLVTPLRRLLPLCTSHTVLAPAGRAIWRHPICLMIRSPKLIRAEYWPGQARPPRPVAYRLPQLPGRVVRLPQAGTLPAAAARIPVRTRRLSRWRTLFSCFVPSIPLGAHAN
jgi:hypothetical protein